MTEESSTYQSYLEVTDVTDKSNSSFRDYDDIHPSAVPKKRLSKFSDSESDMDKENTTIDDDISSNKSEDSGTTNGIEIPQEKCPKRSRIRITANSESDSNSSSEDIQNSKQKKNYESLRTEHKKKSLKEKFKKLTAPRSKSAILETENLQDSDDNVSENSENEISCLKIKHKIKKSAFSMNSVCDPDTSDEEDNKGVIQNKKNKKSKITKPTSPKPIRMSAKQAMENMQKIKSESNRMLREKEVSLPYHRPKALSLKDIMSRKKLAVTSDGKALPIKMNNEQLKQYAMMLEQRQKEVIELCKSDSEEDDTMEHSEQDTNNINKTACNTDQSFIEKDVYNINNEVITCENIIVEDEKMDVDEENETLGIEKEILEGDEQDSQNIETKENLDEGRETLEDKQDMDEEKKNLVTENGIGEEEETIVKEKHFAEEETEIIDEEKKIVPDNKSVNENTSLQNSILDDADMDSIRPYENMEKIPNSKIENESHILDLQYDSEIYIQDKDKEIVNSHEDEFLDNDFSFDEISRIIEEAESNKDVSKIEQLNEAIINTIHSNPLPKLTGGPGMFIDLDNGEATSRKLSGVELLKERFAYYSKLKSREDMEKDREKKYKPGTQHLKLKQELEEQIAEQRSVEWEKRLQEESKLKSEMTTPSDDDDIENIEAKLEEVENDEQSSEGEEEPVENDIILEDKPIKRNPLVDDEAEVSEDEVLDNVPDDDDNNDVDENNEDDDNDDESSDSSSEDEEESKPRKGRILKAFEDSDDESNQKLVQNDERETSTPEPPKRVDGAINDSQDDELQLAQKNISSDNLFSTQELDPNLKVATLNKNNSDNISTDLGTQTFSIMNSVDPSHIAVDLRSPEKDVYGTDSLNKLSTDCSTSGVNTDCFSLNFTQSQNQSQEIGDDVAALCTGKFYDNVFVSQISNNKNETESAEISQEIGDDVAALCTGKFYDNPFVTPNYNIEQENVIITKEKDNVESTKENTILKSILDELDEPEAPKQKYFFSNSKDVTDKKKFVIDSDDEANDGKLVGKRKKLKKRKAEERALHISDDEEDEFEEEEEDYVTDMEEEGERIVEYDSEENEVEIPKKPEKKKRVGEFFENEAELTSEDEWMGSGDEDERGLDRMEREEGDDDKFHQGQLQRELGQIHMREVLDQDKREVRLIQELLFEDGDLGDGHRQRKFRWKNADGETETGTNPDEFADTQEEDFESEEQWRKQRHERELFLRQMQENNKELNTSVNRSTIIKANLNSRNSTSIADNMNKTENETKVPEKKTNKDIPSPKKPFTILQQNYHNSLLTRGRGALARLAALATPLVTDDTPTSIAATNGRNFVFAVKEREEPKVTKRKAESNVNTPRLIKKMKTEETIKKLKSSLFDHFKR